MTWSNVAAPVTAGTLVVTAGCSSSNTATSSAAPPPYISAYLEPPAPKPGPNPDVLFSYDCGRRLCYSNLQAGIASWGYVVVSPDHLERGLAAPALKLTTRPTTEQDTTIMKSSVDRG